MKYFTNEDLNYINSILNKIDVGQSIISGKIEAYNVRAPNESLSKEITEKYSSSPQQGEFVTQYNSNNNNNNNNHSNNYYHQLQHSSSSNNNQQQQQQQYSNSWSHNQQPMQMMTKNRSQPSSPWETQFTPHSPFGPLTHAKSRQTFCNLIEALNQSFPDYDFSNVQPSAFRKEPHIQLVMNHVNIALRDVFSDTDRILLWNILGGIIDMNRCTVYSYNPTDNDPLGCGEGKLWTWNYFFMTKREKKIVLFTCHARSKDSLEDECMSDSDEEQNMKNVEYYYPYVNNWQMETNNSSDELMFEQDW